MPNLDGVKTPPSHKKKINQRYISAKKAEKRDAPKKIIRNNPKNDRVDDLAHLSVEERKRLMWIGVIVVMIAVVGVWIWLLPTSWRVTAEKTDSKDWDNLQKNLSKTIEEFQARTSKENKQLEELRSSVFSNANADANVNINANVNEPINININGETEKVAGEESAENNNASQE